MNLEDRTRKIKIADAYEEAAGHLYKIYEPQWLARSDVLKTLASVSSGAIILSVTFSASLVSLQAARIWRYLILFSFVMFGVALMSALASLWIGIGLHHLQSEYADKRREIQAAVDNIDPSSEDLTAPFRGIVDRINKPFETKDNLAQRLSTASFVSFALAALALIIVGFRQLLP